MKKLAIVCNSLSRGGAERVAVYLAKYTLDNGIDTTIVTATRKDNEYDLFDGMTRVCLTDKLKSKNKLFKLFVQIKNLRSFIKENNIDTLLVMGVPLCIYSIPGCVGTGVKVVVSERNDPRHFAGKRVVCYLARLLMKFADGYVFQTEDAKNFYSNKIRNRGIIIPNPLMVENIPQVYQGEREKVIVTAGRLNSQKNQKLLIDSFVELKDEYPEYKLVIYGQGPLESELKNYVHFKKMDKRIFFPGNVSNLLQEIRTASLFVMSSDFEGMPNALIEAMAVGLPCISTDCPCGGPRELITDGENGVLVPVKNQVELVENIKRVLDNTDFAMMLGDNASIIRQRLSIDNIGKRWINYLDKL